MEDFDSRRTFAGFKFERIVNWLACWNLGLFPPESSFRYFGWNCNSSSSATNLTTRDSNTYSFINMRTDCFDTSAIKSEDFAA